MMFSNTFFASAAAFALFSFDSLLLATGDVLNHVEVVCLPSAPTICIGERTEKIPDAEFVCPDLTDLSTCGVTTVDGDYEWEFVFVDGLREGEGSWPAIQSAMTGLEVNVLVEQDFQTCYVSNGDGEICTSCAVCGEPPAGVQYDCTNLSNGRSSNGECESLDPFLYPFDLGSVAVAPISTTSSSSSTFTVGSLLLPFVVGLVGN